MRREFQGGRTINPEAKGKPVQQEAGAVNVGPPVCTPKDMTRGSRRDSQWILRQGVH